MDNKHSLAIIVSTHDDYSDLWDMFFALFNKYWADCPYDIYLLNNELAPEYNNVKVINCGKDADWSERMRKVLSLFQEPYFLWFHEDFLLNFKIDTNQVSKIIDFIIANKINYYKLASEARVRGDKAFDKSYIYTIPQNLNYGISLTTAIWDKKYFQQLLGDENYNVWKFEINLVEESTKHSNSKESIDNCFVDIRKILPFTHGIKCGKYVPPAIAFLSSEGFYPDTQLRQTMSHKEYFKKVYLPGKISKFIPNKLRNIIRKKSRAKLAGRLK